MFHLKSVISFLKVIIKSVSPERWLPSFHTQVEHKHFQILSGTLPTHSASIENLLYGLQNAFLLTHQQICSDEHSARTRPELPHDDVPFFLVHVPMLQTKPFTSSCTYRSLCIFEHSLYIIYIILSIGKG